MKTETVAENGFKETKIGLIPEDWQVKEFEECIDKERISRDIKIPQGKYKKVGRYPIVDQGASFIAGYTDDKSKLYSGCLPVIVFGDHTRIFKFVDFSFSLGADGTKLIQPKDFLNPKYFYYYLCSLTIESKGYNRHYKYLKEKFLAFPEKPEQQKIAFVLSKIQQIIEQQDRIIETTRELKKSLMNKLFTEGLHGEEQKETEIGLMPKSWDVERVNEVYNFTRKQNKFDIKQHKKIPFIPMKYISEQQRIVDKYDLKEKISSGTFVLKGDLIVAKITPSFENGKQGIVDNIPFEFVYATTEVWPIHNREGKSNINFLHYYLKKPDIRNEIAGKMEGSTGRQRVPKNVLENLKIPFPGYVEQGEISEIFISLDAKISQAESKKQTLQALFRTMLNQLMTGKIGVKDLDIEVN
jgi:type I restriction enzyme S subunit